MKDLNSAVQYCDYHELLANTELGKTIEHQPTSTFLYLDLQVSVYKYMRFLRYRWSSSLLKTTVFKLRALEIKILTTFQTN